METKDHLNNGFNYKKTLISTVVVLLFPSGIYSLTSVSSLMVAVTLSAVQHRRFCCGASNLETFFKPTIL